MKRDPNENQREETGYMNSCNMVQMSQILLEDSFVLFCLKKGVTMDGGEKQTIQKGRNV